MPNQTDDQGLFNALSRAFQDKRMSKSDARKIFDKVEEKHMKFQRQLQASELSVADKQRVYNL